MAITKKKSSNQNGKNGKNQTNNKNVVDKNALQQFISAAVAGAANANVQPEPMRLLYFITQQDSNNITANFKNKLENDLNIKVIFRHLVIDPDRNVVALNNIKLVMVDMATTAMDPPDNVGAHLGNEWAQAWLNQARILDGHKRMILHSYPNRKVCYIVNRDGCHFKRICIYSVIQPENLVCWYSNLEAGQGPPGQMNVTEFRIMRSIKTALRSMETVPNQGTHVFNLDAE